jgi:beta-lactamase class A
VEDGGTRSDGCNGDLAAPAPYAPAMSLPPRAGEQLFLAAALLCVGPGAGAAEPAPAAAATPLERASIHPSPGLQGFLDGAIREFLAHDAPLRGQALRVALIDLPPGGGGSLAHWNGDSPVYPASVVKFVYLMAAFAWRERGLLEIDAELDRELRAMIHVSSNRATQRVLRRLTDTEAGPRLDPEAYAEFRERRQRVERWLRELGIDDLHAVHPTYDGNGDLHGRDVQFLEDGSVEGALPAQAGEYRNRQAMTANGTARLLALLARDLALSPESSAQVRDRMRRDTRRQPYLVQRIAGGAGLRPDLEVYSKTGTWGPIFADAGIVRQRSGHQLVLAVFLEGRPPYRGSFIAELTRRAIAHLLPRPGARLADGPGQEADPSRPTRSEAEPSEGPEPERER